MAQAKNFLDITGSIANFSMYHMQGHDKVIVRSKGGPSKYKIKTKPQFEKTRCNNNEWKGCTKMTSQIRACFYRIKRLEDYPVSGSLNAICKKIQLTDTSNEHGKRSIWLSKNKEMLMGFSLSKKQVLESVLRVPIHAQIDRSTGKATIEIAELNTDLNLYNFRKLPYYRIVASFGGISDIVFVDREYTTYNHHVDFLNTTFTGMYDGPWLLTSGTQPAMLIEQEYPLDPDPIPENVSLILILGIEFGKPGPGDTIEAVKYSGTGKILKMA